MPAILILGLYFWLLRFIKPVIGLKVIKLYQRAISYLLKYISFRFIVYIY
jgi:putative Mn2+ efflux pump MntP